MQMKQQNENKREILSIEEYIKKMRKAKEEERSNGYGKEEKSPVWMLAELYG